MPNETSIDLLGITVRIVASHVANNPVEASALPALIQSVYRTLSSVAEPESAPSEPQLPAVPVNKSIFPDFIVCLEDGMKLKMLKRHLQASYGMTPDDYRTKWGLPRDYPMVAPNYAAIRAGLAKSIGLGRRQSVAAVLEPSELAEPSDPFWKRQGNRTTLLVESSQERERAAAELPAKRARGSTG